MKTSQRDSVGRSLLEIRARLASLTPREREVLDYVVARKSKEKIAGERSKVEQTFKINLAHVMEKMGARSVAELVRLIESRRSKRSRKKR
jgi:FixJ family two-component response regulator